MLLELDGRATQLFSKIAEGNIYDAQISPEKKKGTERDSMKMNHAEHNKSQPEATNQHSDAPESNPEYLLHVFRSLKRSQSISRNKP